MHPPLDRPHPQCQAVIVALLNCHKDNPFAKFFGACNADKRALDKCFKAEKEVRRKRNAEGSEQQMELLDSLRPKPRPQL